MDANWPWQFSRKNLLLAIALAAAGCFSAAMAFKSGQANLGLTWAEIVAAVMAFVAALGLLFGKVGQRVSHGKDSETDPAAKIAARQASIYRRSLIWTTFVSILWAPVIFSVPPGHGCRPMGEVMLSVFVVMPISLAGVVTALYQLYVTWPQKRLGVAAVLVSLIPIATFALSQWVILSALGIIYES